MIGATTHDDWLPDKHLNIEPTCSSRELNYEKLNNIKYLQGQA